MKKKLLSAVSFILVLTMIMAFPLEVFAKGKEPGKKPKVGPAPEVRFGEFDEQTEPAAEETTEETVPEVTSSYFVGDITGKSQNYKAVISVDESAQIPEGTVAKVTEFAEGSAEYEDAKAKVIAEKGEEFEGFAAFDISLYNGEEMIEPASTVKVSIEAKGLPEDATGIEISHINESNGEAIVELVATADDIVTEDSDVNAVFLVNSFSTYTISWRYNGTNYSYNIHYVDTNGNSLTPSMTPTFTNNYMYLIYDIEGYEFDSAHLSSRTGTEFKPQLLAYNNDRYYANNNNGWSQLRSDIYMVYKKKAEPAPGGTAVIDTSGETWPVGNDAPKFSKSSSHNSDGTNTVELSIVAGAKPVEESTPADVIVIFDVSGSMRQNMAGTQSYGNANTQAQNMNHNSRLWLAADAVNKMANILLNGSNHDVRMSLITFSNTATVVQSFTNSYSTFSGKVNTLTADGGTNWERALYLANTMAVRSDAATFVVFVTDGDPTFRMSRGNVADNNIDIDAEYYRNYQVFGAGGSDAQGRNLSFAVDQVSAIAGAKKEFYAIGISTAVTKVRNLTTQGGVDASHAFIASDSTAMDNAFESITESIKSTLGFGDVELTDGITELSSTRMEVMHSVDEKSFKYYITDASGRHEWTTREADGCAPATYNEETGAVEWNMGDGFQLEDDVTYTVTFVVWPSQEAYDLVADLNNGVKSYDSLTAAEKAQIVETVAVPRNIYSLKTNTDQVSASYKKTSKTGDVVSIADETPIEIDATYGTMENMALTSMLLKVHKDFEDDLTAGEDRVDEVVLVLKRRNAHQDPEAEFVEYPVPQAGGVVSANIVLNEANNWTYSLYIAPGFEVDGEILEHGYDFTIEEPNINYHYGLIEEIINPMVVDGEERYYGDGYLLDDEQVIQQYVDRSLTAVNRVKSGIDIRKVVVDDDGAEISSTEEFTIKGKILGPDGNPYTFDNAALDQRTDKNSSTWVPANQSAHQNDPIAYHKYVEDPEAVPGTNGAIEAYGKKYRRTIYKGHFDSTAAIEFTLKTDELLRFINVPESCTFEFDEDMTKMPDGYEWDSSKGTAQHRTKPEGPFTPEGDVQPTVDGSKIILAKSETSTGIVGNKQYTVIFTNKAIHGEYFFVYHSSDNKIEKIFADDDRVTKGAYDEQAHTYTYTFDIVAETKQGFLYGGYYKAYAGQKLDDEGITALEYDNTNWATDAAGCAPYDGSKATAWKKNNAYPVKGTAMHPVANTVYYLKEVPDSYLRPYIQIVYDTYSTDPVNPIVKLYIITATDDANYTDAGLLYNSTTDKSAGKLSSTVKITKPDGSSTTLTAKSVFNGKVYPDKSAVVPRGYLTSVDMSSSLVDFTMQPYFKTLDGVKVFGVTERAVEVGDKTFVDDGNGVGKKPGITVTDVTKIKACE